MPMMGIPFAGSTDIFSILVTAFLIWMMVDVCFNKQIRGGSKIFWFLFILFTNLLGAVIYFFVECKHRNPIEALQYYYNTLTGSGWSAPQAPFTASSRPTPPPPVYTPPAEHGDYVQGYRAQSSPAPLPSVSQPGASSSTQPPLEQPEYEEPIVMYPEMPPM